MTRPVSVIPIQPESASLALEIVDQEHQMPLPPPPVPDPSSPVIETRSRQWTIPVFSRDGHRQVSIEYEYGLPPSRDPTPTLPQRLIGSLSPSSPEAGNCRCHTQPCPSAAPRPYRHLFVPAEGYIMPVMGVWSRIVCPST